MNSIHQLLSELVNPLMAQLRPSMSPFQKRRLQNNVCTDNGLGVYWTSFNFSPEDLRGKTILDVGSGKRESFSKEAAKYGAIVHSLSPAYRNWYPRKRAKGLILKDKRWQGRSVAALAQQLPYKDESLDIIFSHFMLSHYFCYQGAEEDKFQTIKEMVRTLKPGGRIYTCPVNDLDPTIEETIGKKSLDWLWENSWQVKFNDLEAILITKHLDEKESRKWMDSKKDYKQQERFKRWRIREGRSIPRPT